MRKVNKKISILVIALILMIGIGYAAITTTLTITGNTGISGDSSNFQNNVFFYSANLTSTGLKTEDTTAAQPKLNGNTMRFTVPATSALKVVGDKIEVNYTIRNESNYNALIAVPTVESTATDFLDYFTVTHSRSENLNLGVNTTSDSQKLTLTLKQTYADITAKNFTFTVKINATAVDGTVSGTGGDHGVVNVNTVSFAEDSWETISEAVTLGKTENYHVGDTKTVDMGNFGTHTLRIANTTTPLECSNPDFSQTACGFVLEFADIITTHNMNPAGEYQGTNYSAGWSKDGYPASSMHKYLENDIYNALPATLINAIIPTKVVSSRGNADTTNFTTTENLYLLSAHEVWEDGTSNQVSTYDTSWSKTRQLDYYKNLGVSTSNYSGAIKQYNGSNYNWWLRSARSYIGYLFIDVIYTGAWFAADANFTYGISPAFRIG